MIMNFHVVQVVIGSVIINNYQKEMHFSFFKNVETCSGVWFEWKKKTGYGHKKCKSRMTNYYQLLTEND